jgi:hypothetical protein
MATIRNKAPANLPGSRTKPLTFGDFVEAAYKACGKRKATGIVRLAVNARLVEFQGGQLFEFSEP